MTYTPEQWLAAQKAQVETLFGLTQTAFEGVEKLVELNLQVTKTSLSELAEKIENLPWRVLDSDRADTERRLADQPLAGLAERNDRGGDAATLRILNDRGLIALHDGHNGVRRAKVDADDFAHGIKYEI